MKSTHTHKRIGYYLSRLCANADRHLGRHVPFNPHDFDFCCAHTRVADDINESTPTACVRQCFARITPQLFCHLFVSATHTHTVHFQSEQREWEGDRSPSITNTIVREETTHTNVRSISAHGRRLKGLKGRGTGNHRNPSHTHTHTPTTS